MRALASTGLDRTAVIQMLRAFWNKLNEEKESLKEGARLFVAWLAVHGNDHDARLIS